MQIEKRDHGYQMAREALARKKALMEMIPDVTNVGTISDFMFKAGVQARRRPSPPPPLACARLGPRSRALSRARSLSRSLKLGLTASPAPQAAEPRASPYQDILAELDHDLVGLLAVKTRVREIASLLVVDKVLRSSSCSSGCSSCTSSCTSGQGATSQHPTPFPDPWPLALFPGPFPDPEPTP